MNNLIRSDPVTWDLSPSDQEAHAIPLSESSGEDTLFWPHQKLGSYSVKSCYHFATSIVLPYFKGYHFSSDFTSGVGIDLELNLSFEN